MLACLLDQSKNNARSIKNTKKHTRTSNNDSHETNKKKQCNRNKKTLKSVLSSCWRFSRKCYRCCLAASCFVLFFGGPGPPQKKTCKKGGSQKARKSHRGLLICLIYAFTAAYQPHLGFLQPHRALGVLHREPASLPILDSLAPSVASRRAVDW